MFYEGIMLLKGNWNILYELGNKQYKYINLIKNHMGPMWKKCFYISILTAEIIRATNWPNQNPAQPGIHSVIINCAMVETMNSERLGLLILIFIKLSFLISTIQHESDKA